MTTICVAGDNIPISAFIKSLSGAYGNAVLRRVFAGVVNVLGRNSITLTAIYVGGHIRALRGKRSVTGLSCDG